MIIIVFFKKILVLEILIEQAFIDAMDARMEGMSLEEVEKLAKSMNAQIFLCAFGIIRKDDNSDEFLLLKRSSKEKLFPNQWGLPGGTFKEEDGSPDQTVIRETKEETNLTAEVKETLGIYHSPMMVEGKLLIFRTYLYSLEISYKEENQIKLDTEEHSEWVFMDYENAVTTLNLAGKTGTFMRNLKSNQ